MAKSFFFAPLRQRQKKMSDHKMTNLESLIEFILENSQESQTSDESFSSEEIDQFRVTHDRLQLESRHVNRVFTPLDHDFGFEDAAGRGAKFAEGEVNTASVLLTGNLNGKVHLGYLPRRGFFVTPVMIPLGNSNNNDDDAKEYSPLHPWFFLTNVWLGSYPRGSDGDDEADLNTGDEVLSDTLSTVDHVLGLTSTNMRVTSAGMNFFAALDAEGKHVVQLPIYIWFNFFQCLIAYGRTTQWNDKLFHGARYRLPRRLRWFPWKP